VVALVQQLLGNSTILKIFQPENLWNSNKLDFIFYEMFLQFFFDSQELLHVRVVINFDEQQILTI
jgi:hypothetical protein